MTITKTDNNGILTMKVEGLLDILSSPELDAEIEKLSDFTALILDFDELKFMSSSGLRVVISAYKKAVVSHADFEIINVPENVMGVFELTKMNEKFKITKK